MPHLHDHAWFSALPRRKKRLGNAQNLRARKLSFEALELRWVLDGSANPPTLTSPLADLTSGANVTTASNLSSHFADADIPTGDSLAYYATRTNDPAAASPILQPLASGLNRPQQIVPANDGTGRLFVIEQNGLVRIVRPTSAADSA